MSGARQQASVTASFLGLPVDIRNNIYNRLLTVPQPLQLFQEPGSRVDSFSPGRPRRWLALLYTNRQILNEARAVLYGANQFILEEVETKYYRSTLLRSFLNTIGPVNAASLSRISITFPATEKIEGQPGGVKLRDDSLQTLQLLQNQCTKLQTLETLVYGPNSSALVQENLNNNKSNQDVLSELDADFRSITSLSKRIVKFVSGPPDSSVKEFLEDRGWIIISSHR